MTENNFLLSFLMYRVQNVIDIDAVDILRRTTATVTEQQQQFYIDYENYDFLTWSQKQNNHLNTTFHHVSSNDRQNVQN